MKVPGISTAPNLSSWLGDDGDGYSQFLSLLPYWAAEKVKRTPKKRNVNEWTSDWWMVCILGNLSSWLSSCGTMLGNWTIILVMISKSQFSL